jgi:GNAT superfamily N-acetyltransferase
MNVADMSVVIEPLTRRWKLACHNLVSQDFAKDPKPLEGACDLSRVAILNDKLVGVALIDANGYLIYLVVKDEFRGKGIGSKLLTTCLSSIKSLTCNHSKVSFYSKFGFKLETCYMLRDANTV